LTWPGALLTVVAATAALTEGEEDTCSCKQNAKHDTGDHIDMARCVVP
jgi:hypothetical protein